MSGDRTEGPGPIARWGPMVAILGAIALLVGVVLVAEPIDAARATGPSSAPERGRRHDRDRAAAGGDDL
ncbi:MAG: hypothetical protein IPH29_09205 [Candidatus Microthrix sp.]|nr:hypothetical protein [Candidatus Microthrix sp.]